MLTTKLMRSRAAYPVNGHRTSSSNKQSVIPTIIPIWCPRSRAGKSPPRPSAGRAWVLIPMGPLSAAEPSPARCSLCPPRDAGRAAPRIPGQAPTSGSNLLKDKAPGQGGDRAPEAPLGQSGFAGGQNQTVEGRVLRPLQSHRWGVNERSRNACSSLRPCVCCMARIRGKRRQKQIAAPIRLLEDHHMAGAGEPGEACLRQLRRHARHARADPAAVGEGGVAGDEMNGGARRRQALPRVGGAVDAEDGGFYFRWAAQREPA